MALSWSGIFAIPVTPFNEDLSVDEVSFKKELEFCLKSGVHGLAYPAVVSEFFTLDDDERKRLLEIVVNETGGALPVIAGVSAPSSPHSAKLAQHAKRCGAAGVMTMIPYVQHFFKPDLAYAIRHLQMVAEAELPIIFQNARIGYPMPISQLPAIMEAVPSIQYVKEETSPATHQLARAVAALAGRDIGVFGGLGGIYLLEELSRGAVGSMPAPVFADILVDIYALWANDRKRDARNKLNALTGAFTYELLYNVSFIKEILRLRGVIKTSVCRVPAPVMDEADIDEFDHIIANIDAVLSV